MTTERFNSGPDSYGDHLEVWLREDYAVARVSEDGVTSAAHLTRGAAAGLVAYLQEWLLASDPAKPCEAGCVAEGDHRATGCLVPAPTCCAGEDSSECCPTVVPSILEEAHAAVYGDRQDDYGHPREDFTRTAIIWTGLLQHKLADGEYIEAEDVPRCMIGVKLARDVNAPKRDNRVDGAGYFLTLDRLETGR